MAGIALARPFAVLVLIAGAIGAGLGARHFRMVAVELVLFLSIVLMPRGLLSEAQTLRFLRGYSPRQPQS